MIGRLRWKLPVAALLGIAVALAAPSGIPGHSTACGKAWIFFDLGNTLVASAPGQESSYIPGAHAYVQELRKRGYHVGLITNVPEKWGPTRTEKLHELKKVIEESWTKTAGAEAMDWTDFPDPSIVLPRSDSERKPAPYLFQAALDQVSLAEGAKNCPVIYQGEDPVEITAAEKAGMTGYLVGKDPAAPFMPFDRLERR